MDNYLSLKPMSEEEATKFTTLHLDGVAHEWWYHGLITLGHYYITSYDEFINRLIKRFDHKEPKMYFRKLAQLKQYGSLVASVSKFQRLSVMVTDISERRLIVLFIEGLSNPLCTWIREFDPPTLQLSMKKARSMDHAHSRNKSSSRHFPNNKDKKPFHKTSNQCKENHFKNTSMSP